ncbi:MAG: Crp/Fnr family transcriptional regulator [Myxococcaceae bacterium]|nr:Crp/Fnr family transcriptional regulator [Myxococcaceae bacterium]
MIDEPVARCSECVVQGAGRCPFTTRTVQAGERLWMQGDVPREVLFVKDGLVSLSTTEPTGEESLSAVRGPRSLLGTEALSSRPANASAEALTDVTVCASAPTSIQQWVGPATPASALVGLLVDEHARHTRDANLRTGPSLSRLARFLVEFSKLVEGGRKAPFSKQHVARILGMRAETLSRSLRQLVDAGIIESGRQVRVRDPARLAAIARGSA